MSATTTLAPSSANRSAVARPIPPPPPVMKATLFASLGIAASSSCLGRFLEDPQSRMPQVFTRVKTSDGAAAVDHPAALQCSGYFVLLNDLGLRPVVTEKDRRHQGTGPARRSRPRRSSGSLPDFGSILSGPC